jgi:hypothetical protein
VAIARRVLQVGFPVRCGKYNFIAQENPHSFRKESSDRVGIFHTPWWLQVKESLRPLLAVHAPFTTTRSPGFMMAADLLQAGQKTTL